MYKWYATHICQDLEGSGDPVIIYRNVATNNTMNVPMRNSKGNPKPRPSPSSSALLSMWCKEGAAVTVSVTVALLSEPDDVAEGTVTEEANAEGSVASVILKVRDSK
jgi:hypothetical protein